LKALLLTLMLIAGYAFQTYAQPQIRTLPKGAVVIETRQLANSEHPDRLLVLWMLNPKGNPNGYAPDEPYTCPDYSRGSYFSGPTRVSLLETKTNRVINTIKIAEDAGEDTFDVPYAIRKGYHYRVESAVRRGIEIKPTIIWLRDHNGDGKALEFAMFDAVACMGLATTLVGYSGKQDRVIQYQISLDVVEGSGHTRRVTAWPDYLFNNKPLRPGYWKYEIDYRGRGGSLDEWEVRYNPAKEWFEGKLTVVPDE
jgi:hypothetical protein